MWKHPKELNKIEDFSKPIIYWTWNNKCAVFKDLIVFYGKPENIGTLEQHIDNWVWKARKYNIKWWMFVEEIQPMGILGNGGSLADWYGCDEKDITREMWNAIGDKNDELVKKMCKELKGNC